MGWTSVLEGFPDHVKSIGMISIEAGNVDLSLTWILQEALGVTGEVSHAIYMSPKQAHTRLDIFRNALFARFTPRFPNDTPNEVINGLAEIRKEIDVLYKRAMDLSTRRNSTMHDLWGLEHTGEVVRHHLPIKDFAKPATPVPLAELEQLIREMRAFIDDAKKFRQSLVDQRLKAVLKTPSPEVL